MIEISDDTFAAIASKLQNELADVILAKKEINDYELIVYKYVFISELKIPLQEDFGFEMDDGSFILYVIPDNLKFTVLKSLDDVFTRFELSFMANEYGLLKVKFELKC
ncbi:hypothetical protein [Methanobrevibacter sp.]|uniref:hypothetical protein n=1 Tax=Methanobrevibacter sp. TaxID=66852 RepID=UPI00388F00C9